MVKGVCLISRFLLLHRLLLRLLRRLVLLRRGRPLLPRLRGTSRWQWALPRSPLLLSKRRLLWTRSWLLRWLPRRELPTRSLLLLRLTPGALHRRALSALTLLLLMLLTIRARGGALMRIRWRSPWPWWAVPRVASVLLRRIARLLTLLSRRRRYSVTRETVIASLILLIASLKDCLPNSF